jgi:hypothetical protein
MKISDEKRAVLAEMRVGQNGFGVIFELECKNKKRGIRYIVPYDDLGEIIDISDIMDYGFPQ